MGMIWKMKMNKDQFRYLTKTLQEFRGEFLESEAADCIDAVLTLLGKSQGGHPIEGRKPITHAVPRAGEGL